MRFFFFSYKIVSVSQFMSVRFTIEAFLVEQNGIMHVFRWSSVFWLDFSASHRERHLGMSCMRVTHMVNLGDDVSKALGGNKNDGVSFGPLRDQGSTVR